jgi:hypothetical protein
MPLNSKVKFVQVLDNLELVCIAAYLSYQYLMPDIKQKDKFIGFAIAGSGAYLY